MTIEIKPIGYCTKRTIKEPTHFKGPIYSEAMYGISSAIYDQAAIDALQARIAELEAPQEPVAYRFMNEDGPETDWIAGSPMGNETLIYPAIRIDVAYAAPILPVLQESPK